MYTIVGSGFGLYGYLPALINYSKELVTLSEKYIPIIEGREELRYLLPSIRWVKTQEKALADSDSLILAVPPFVQEEFLLQTNKISHIKKIIIEKPIAVNPDKAKKILLKLFEMKKSIRIGFSFLFTDWYLKISSLNKILDSGFTIKLSWEFQAHHFAKDIDTWKRYASLGGAY